MSQIKRLTPRYRDGVCNLLFPIICHPYIPYEMIFILVYIRRLSLQGIQVMLDTAASSSSAMEGPAQFILVCARVTGTTSLTDLVEVFLTISGKAGMYCPTFQIFSCY